MKKNKTLLIGVASAVGIALIALAIFIAYTLNPANKYTRTVTSAEKYYQEGDYQNSILAYEDAIAQDPNNVNAYIGLANVYVDQNQTDMAIAAEHLLKTRKRLEKILADNSGKTIRQIHKDAERDYWMTAEETLAYGFIDEIMENNALK